MNSKKITDSDISALKISSLPTRPTAPAEFGGKGYTATELKAAFADLPDGDGLIELRGETLYLTGKNDSAVRRAVMSYLEILDEVEKNRKKR